MQNNTLDPMRNQAIASYSLFRVLYDRSKDVYSVLEQMILQIIVSKALRKVTIGELDNFIKQEFEMSIPQSVLKTVMKRLSPSIRRDHFTYFVEKEIEIDNDVIDEIDTANNQANQLMEDLVSFIRIKTEEKLTAKQIASIQKSFFEFLIGTATQSDFLVPISNFVVKNKDNPTLNTIKEGVLLFQGLKDTNGAPTDNPFRPLIIYLGMDVLFDLGGLNGQMYQEAMKTLISYIFEVNRMGEQITLKYTKSVKERIEKYYSSVKFDYDNNKVYNRTDSASDKILEGVSSSADIMERQFELFQLFSRNSIVEDNPSVFSNKRNWDFNQISQELIHDVTSEEGDPYNDDEINRAIEELNEIYILRQGCDEKFILNSRVLLLTRTNLYRRISVKFVNQEISKAPVAVNVDHLLNIFWYKLGKGFGTNLVPSCLSVLSNAQALLASEARKKLAFEYEKARKSYSEGNLSEEKLVNLAYQFKTAKIEASDITSENVDPVVNLLSEDGFEEFCNEKERMRAQITSEQEEKRTLQQEIEKYSKSQERLVEDNQIKQGQLFNSWNNNLDHENSLLAKLKTKERRLKIIALILGLSVWLVFLVLVVSVVWAVLQMTITIQGEESTLNNFINNNTVMVSIAVGIILQVVAFIKKAPEVILDWIKNLVYKLLTKISKFDQTQINDCEERIKSLQELVKSVSQ